MTLKKGVTRFLKNRVTPFYFILIIVILKISTWAATATMAGFEQKEGNHDGQWEKFFPVFHRAIIIYCVKCLGLVIQTAKTLPYCSRRCYLLAFRGKIKVFSQNIILSDYKEIGFHITLISLRPRVHLLLITIAHAIIRYYIFVFPCQTTSLWRICAIARSYGIGDSATRFRWKMGV
jgi:hypothetical protein